MNLLLLALLPAFGLACGKGFNTWIDGRCFRHYYFFFTISYEDQESDCANNYNGAHLPIVRSQEENDQFFDVLAVYREGPHSFWICLRCDGEKFVWSDGTEATYTNFAGNYTCSTSTTEHRYFVNNDRLWYEVANGTVVVDENGYAIGNTLICEARERSSSPCDDFDKLKWGESETCVKVSATARDWQSAEEDCVEDAAHLPSIHDQAADEGVLHTALQHSLVDEILIGARKDRSGVFSWTDGSKMDYRNFAPGFPNDVYGSCVAMKTVYERGQWMSVPCQKAPLPYMCTKEPFYPTNPQPAGCPKRNNFKPGDEIFSPSYPLPPGVTTCDYFLIEPNSSKQAEIEISFLELNACCDHLIVYDGLLGSIILEKLTGYQSTPITIRATTNAIRLQWNATSGANVRGFKARMNEL